MKDNKFSVIVPIYNVEKYLNCCVDSILEQSYLNFELILVDDGSTDNSSLICDDYALIDSRVKVIHKINGGLVSARKAGAKIAKGDYVLNIDGDDFIDKYTLETINRIINEYHPEVVIFKFMRFGNAVNYRCKGFTCDKGLYDEKKIDFLRKRILCNEDNPFFSIGIEPSLCIKAVKRELYVREQLETLDSIKMGEDLAVSLPILLKAQNVYLLDCALYKYRYNENSITNTLKFDEIQNIYNLIKHIETRVDLNRYNIHQQLAGYITNRVFECLFTFAHSVETYKEYKQIFSRIPQELMSYIRSYNASCKSMKSFLIPLTIKFKMWRLFWIYYHR